MESVYIHIPFCKTICSYCDFCKMFYNSSWADEYLDVLKEEILDSYDNDVIKTIYIGGGTPSCLPKENLIKLFEIIKLFKKSNDLEFTFECNISDINYELLNILKINGVNRLSIGVNSFNKKNLEFLERESNYKDVKEKINLCKALGFNNINVDLMYALPNETLKDLKKDVKKLLSLNITHLSTYSLIIEEHTKVGNSKINNIDEDLDYKMYEYICKKARHKKFNHYEVSNFAKKGFESRHNLAYWKNKEYYGFGLSASGYMMGFRYENTHDIKKYSNHVYRKENNVLSINDKMENEVMLGLRLLNGINVKEFYDKYTKNIQNVFPIEPLIKEKLLTFKDGYLKVSEKNIYILNEILLKLF